MQFTKKNKGTTICLCMIVKDSAEHILRCLESVKSIVDSYAIIDTGSRDDTIKIIKKFFRHTKGKIIKNKYPIDPEFGCIMDFSKARTDSLKLAEGRGTYVLIMDADEILLIDPAFDKESLKDDLYNVLTADNAEYTRPRLIRNDRDWWFEDVVHEWLESGMTIRTRSTIPTLKFHLFPKAGNRHLHRNLKLLTAGNKERPDYTRYIFYLAQTYAVVFKGCGIMSMA
jgi:glycosyltransferase involved in cell wall biosynthesis